ncbi:MAG: hypothetical protein ACU0CI_09655 [Shimia sp.]
MKQHRVISYPAILFADDGDGLFGVVVPDLALNAGGATQEAAIDDAVSSVLELLGDMATSGEAFPEASLSTELELDGGTLILLTVPVPTKEAAT